MQAARYESQRILQMEKQVWGLEVSQLKRLKELEEENRRLKKMFAELSLDHEILKDIIEKTLSVAERRDLVDYTVDVHATSERRACCLISLSRAVYRYQTRKTDDIVLDKQLHELAQRHRRWEFKKMMALHEKEGLSVQSQACLSVVL